jgi:predicted MFS family arabinose efflux permease
MSKFGFRKLMVFIILSATVAIAYQLPYLRYTFYDQMMEVLKFNNTQMGVMATAVSLTSTLCYPIGGFFASRFSTRSLMCITLAAFVGLTVWYAFTTNYIMLLIIHVLYGFFGIATLWSAYLSGIRNLGTKDNQSTLFGSSEATRGILQTILGFAFLGVMGVSLTPEIGFRGLLLIGAGVTAVFLILAIIYLPKGQSIEEDTSDQDQIKECSLVDVLKNKGIWILTIMIMGAYTIWSMGNGYLTTYTVQVLDISTSLASTLGIVRSYIIVFVAGFLGGWVLDRFSYKGKAFLIMFGTVIVAYLGVMLTNKAVAICIGITLVLAFIANVMKSTYWSTMEQAGIPVYMTPLATGIISFIAFMPDFALPPIFGAILDNAAAAGNIAGGFNKIFIIIIAFAVMGIVGSILLTRRTQKLNVER